jgi:DNA-binding FadR family transcriptional regulator
VAEAVVEPVGGRGGRVAVAPGAHTGMPAASEASLAEFDEILDFRLAAECTTARLAAERRDEAGLAALRAALAELQAARSGRGPGGYVRFHRADAAFHAAVAQTSGNTLLARAVADAHARMFLPIGAVFAEVAESADERHAAIVEAIAAGDGAAAEEAMRAHVESTRADVKAMLGAPRSRAVLA